MKIVRKNRLNEMALIGYSAKRGGFKGMKLEIISSEYKGTGEEPHIHLFPANHIDKDGKSNNHDLITRVKLTKEFPKSPNDIVAIKDNPEIQDEYKEEIYKWSQMNNKYGINNWLNALNIWDAIQGVLDNGR